MIKNSKIHFFSKKSLMLNDLKNIDVDEIVSVLRNRFTRYKYVD